MLDPKVGDIVQLNPNADIEIPYGALVKYGDIGVVTDTPIDWRFMVYVDFPLNGWTQAVLTRNLVIVGHVDG